MGRRRGSAAWGLAVTLRPAEAWIRDVEIER